MHGVAPFGRQRRERRLARAGTDRLLLAGHREDARDARLRVADVAGAQLQRGALADQLAALVGVLFRQQRIERDVDGIRIAIKRLAVRKAELQRLDQRVHELGPERVHRGDVVCFEQPQRLQEHRPLRPGPKLVHREPVVIDRGRLLDARVIAREVVAGEQAAMALAGRVHQFAAVELVDRLGDEALVVGVARRLDLPHAIAARASRLARGCACTSRR